MRKYYNGDWKKPERTIKDIIKKEDMNIYKKTTLEHAAEFEFFKKNIFHHTLKWEGGAKLHKVKGDSGGWTKYGIAYNKNKRLFRSLEDFMDTTYDEASEIAFVKYYMAIQAHLVPVEAKMMYFDIAFNMGNSRAIKYMQQCIGVKADKIIGEITKANMHKLTSQCLFKKRKGFYNWLVNRNRRMKKFYNGWMNRTNAIIKIKN